jgi:hypothetical protein
MGKNALDLNNMEINWKCIRQSKIKEQVYCSQKNR